MTLVEPPIIACHEALTEAQHQGVTVTALVEPAADSCATHKQILMLICAGRNLLYSKILSTGKAEGSIGKGAFHVVEHILHLNKQN